MNALMMRQPLLIASLPAHAESMAHPAVAIEQFREHRLPTA